MLHAARFGSWSEIFLVNRRREGRNFQEIKNHESLLDSSRWDTGRLNFLGPFPDVFQMLQEARTVAKINTYKLNLLFSCLIHGENICSDKQFYISNKIFFLEQVNTKIQNWENIQFESQMKININFSLNLFSKIKYKKLFVRRKAIQSLNKTRTH